MWMLLAACKEAADAAPEGLDPLESLEVEAPSPEDGDPTPESLAMQSWEDEDGVAVTHAWAFVDADISSVVGALREPDVGVDRRRMASWTVEWDTLPDYELSYTVANHSEEFIPVDFDVAWGHGASNEDEAGAATLWSKTDGTEYIYLLEGWAQVFPYEDSVAVQMIYHLDTIDSDTGDAEQYVTDFYQSLLAVAHGEDLPEY